MHAFYQSQVEQAVKIYFTDQFRQFPTAQSREVQFGTRHGIADVVLHQPIRDERGYFVAIAACKRLPLPILRAQASAQLKRYMSVTSPIATLPHAKSFQSNIYPITDHTTKQERSHATRKKA